MPDRETLEVELRTLAERRERIEHGLRHARDRARYVTDPQVAAAAQAEEQAILRELDRLMTRTRAVEGQLLRLLGTE